MFLTLNISVTGAGIFLWWVETELSFLNRSWNKDDIKPYVILNVLSYEEFILLLRLLLWNIQTKEQYPNWDVTNAFTSYFLFSRHMCETTLPNVLPWLFMWSWKDSCESKTIPSSSFLFSEMMVLTLPFPENSIWLFATIDFNVIKNKPFEKNFGIVFYFFY